MYQHIQLFRESLSKKVHATIPKGIVGGFELAVLQGRRAQEAMDVYLRVPKESNTKEVFTASESGTVY